MPERIMVYVVKYPCKCPHRQVWSVDKDSNVVVCHICKILSTKDNIVRCEHPFEFPAVCQLAMRGEKDGK